MPRGRPAKPKHLKLLEGDRQDRINDQEPEPSEDDVLPPEWLDARGLGIWKNMAPDLITKRVLTPWDADLFGQWCDAAARAQVASTLLNEEGEVIVTTFGRSKNPWFQVWRDSVTTMMTIGARFGLTPSDRTRISVGDKPNATGAKRLLS